MIPRATYRLQFHAGFTFAAATAVVPYLARLGASHLYASPIFAARRGSTHGYDVTDPTRLNPELGTEAGFDALASACREHGMGILLDIVPNHMAASVDNPWWRDVLAKGQASPYAKFFDIAWDDEGGKLVLPVLGAPVEQAIADGHVARDADALVVHGQRYPIADGTPDGPVANVLPHQSYRLTFWREALPNYRRFFEINDLVGLRVEDPDVFEATHALALRLLSEKCIDGLRVDHIDGLRDPLEYLRRLRERVGSEAYIVVEKILGKGEPLPDNWPVDGTTGYDLLGAANGLLADGTGLRTLSRTYRELAGQAIPEEDVVYRRKRDVLATRFDRELRWLSQAFARIAEVAEDLARDTILDLSACLPVYRTYVASAGVTQTDAACLTATVQQAIASDADRDATERLRDVILDAPNDPEALEFTLRWQQLTGPAMAKGLEDSTFYRYNRLISLNEVGGHGESITPMAFHHFVRSRASRWPHTMNGSSTHDTKRSEDVRARLAGLAEDPRIWTVVARQLTKAAVDGGAPEIDANTQYHLLQAAIGCWPMGPDDTFPERLAAYMLKAVREAAEHTSWTANDEGYEASVTGFATWLTSDPRAEKARGRIERFVRRLDSTSFKRSIAQLTLKLTLPGVPDTYQGQELWDLSFVDPDNRRPVDYGARARLLEDVSREGVTLRELLREPLDGRAKLLVTHRLLRLRRDLPELFASPDYRPLAQREPAFLAFARRHGRSWLVVVVPTSFAGRPKQLAVPLPSLAPTRWTDVLNGGTLRTRDNTLPVAKALLSGMPLVIVPAQ